MSLEKEQELRELINRFLTEYTGTGASGGNAGDGNSITSPRPYPDDATEVQKAYMDKNVGYGGDGGHYLQEPAFSNFNRKKMVKFEQLRKAIRPYLEQAVKENTFYGNREQPSQLSTGTKVSVPTDEYPFSKKPKRTATGMMEDVDSEIEQNAKAQIQNQIDAGNLAIKGSSLNLKKLKSGNQLTQQQSGKTVGDADQKKSKEAGDVLKIKKAIVAASTELRQLQTKQEYRPDSLSDEEIEKLDTTLPELLATLKASLEKENAEKIAALDAYQQAVKAKTQADAGISKGERDAERAHRKTVKDTKKQQSLAKKGMRENLYNNYIKNRKNKNLMEFMDIHKREALMEGAVKKIFRKYDEGLTNEEIMQYYAKEGIQVPEQFLGKVKKQYEQFQKLKLEVELADKESKEFKKISLTDEELGPQEEPKQLASGLMKENEIIGRYPIPPEIEDALTNTLKMKPLIRFVENLKAVNSIPPSYRIFLLNGQHFDIIYESYSLKVEIGTKNYFLADVADKNNAIKHINKLMTSPIPKKGDEEGGGLDDLLGGLAKGKGKGKGSKPPAGGGAPPPPPPPSPEPEDEA
jgi:hypothetical protein